MPAPESVEARLYELVVGKGSPMPVLLNTGVLSPDWVDAYLALLKEAEREWKPQACWPRELVTAIHVASWYLHIRYEAWSGFEKKKNDATERLLGRIRFHSESFLLSPICDISAVNAEQGASPNGGPGLRPDNSGVGGGPPSVS